MKKSRAFHELESRNISIIHKCSCVFRILRERDTLLPPRCICDLYIVVIVYPMTNIYTNDTHELIGNK